MRIKRFALFLSALFVLMSIPVAVMAQDTGSASDENQYQPGEAIVCLTRSAVTSMADDELLASSESLLTLSGNNGDIKTASDGDITELRLVRSGSLSTEELVKQLKGKPGVLYAEPNYIYTVEQVSDNTDSAAASVNVLQAQSQVDDSDSVYTGDFTFLQYASTGENSIDVPDWNNPDNVNAKDIVVAVLDTGVNYTHEDLAPVMWDKGLDYPELTAMGGGKYGLNTEEKNGSEPMDTFGHGTHCAGNIGAAWNGKGISGVANGVKIMGIKLGSKVFSLSNIIMGYRYVIAAKNAGVNVKVTSNSYGGKDLSLAYSDVVKEAANYGIVSIKAAGNISQDVDLGSLDYGTFKTAPEMVLVGASNMAGDATGFSDFGRRTTNVFAPGEDIFSTVLDNGGPQRYAVSQPAEGTEDTFNPEKSRLYTGASTDASFVFDSGHGGVTYSAKAEDTAVGVEAEKGWNGSGAMVIKSGNGKNAAIHVTGSSRTKSGSLLMSVRTPVDGILFWLDDQSKNVVTCNVSADKWTDFVVDGKYFTDKSALFFHPSAEGTGYELAVNGMYFSEDKPDYDQQSGTSMATPVVAGEAAILCAKYPSDSAEKIAARIKGSVNAKDALADKSVSGGIASTRKALAGETIPVLSDCLKTDDGTCTLTGYFFGETGGTLKVDGQTVQPSSWSDTTITFAYNDSLMKGEHIYEVASSVGSGRQYFTLQNSDDLMDRLPTPDDVLFDNSLVTSSCGLDGKIYFMMHQEEPQRLSSLWSYTPGDGGGWEMLSAKLPFDFVDGKICAWNHKLLVPCLKAEASVGTNTNMTENIAVYDPKTGDTRYIDVPEAARPNVFSLHNTGDRVYAYYAADIIGLLKLPTLGIVDPRNLTFNVCQIKNPQNMNVRNTPTANMFFDDGGNLFVIGGAVNILDTYLFVPQLAAVNPDADLADRMRTVSDDVFGEGFPEKQEMSPIAAEPVEGGAIISGFVKTDEAGHVVADTFKLNTGAVNTSSEGGDIKLEPIDKRVSDTKVSAITGTVYDNHFYTLGFTDNDMTNRVFTDYPVLGSNNAGDSSAPSVVYEGHGRNYGWQQGEKHDGVMVGTTGQALRLEALRVSIKDDNSNKLNGLGVTYRVHMKNNGWGPWTQDGSQAGTVGESRRIEAAEIKLTGDKAENYDIYYRVHMKDIGWGDWVKNGEMAGTTGQCRRFEAINIKIVPKGGAAPAK